MQNISESLNLVKSIVGLEDTSKDPMIISWLTASSGIDTTGSTVYRPYIVAHRFLTIFPARGGVIKHQGTDGIEWERSDVLMNGLLDTQKAFDQNISNISADWVIGAGTFHILSAFVV
jgi:hypothetical protein